MDDNLILKQIKEGQTDKFGLLYDKYIRQVYDFIYYKTQHKETAEDLTSITFAKAMKGLNGFKEGNFRAWLYRIARNSVIDHYRAKREERNINDFWDLADRIDLEVDTENKLKIEELNKYLKSLQPEQREIIILRLWQGLSYAEIAQITGKKEPSCKMMFGRTINKIRQEAPWALIVMLLIK